MRIHPPHAALSIRLSRHLPDQEVEQVPFLPFIDDRLSGLVRPPDHLDRRRRIVRHEVDDGPDLDPREQLVQLREDLGADLAKDPADGRADPTEILPARQEPDGGASGVRDSERFGCDLHDRPRECREDAGNPDDKVPGHEGASPDESLRVVEEVVRELTVFDFHEEGSSTRRTSARRSSASASDRTLSSGASESVAAPRGNTVAPFTLTGPPLRTYR